MHHHLEFTKLSILCLTIVKPPPQVRDHRYGKVKSNTMLNKDHPSINISFLVKNISYRHKAAESTKHIAKSIEICLNLFAQLTQCGP